MAKGKNNKALLIVLIVVVIAVLGVLIWALVIEPNRQKELEQQQQENLQQEENAALGILPGMNDDEVQERINTIVSESMLNISMNTEPTFEDGSAQGKLNIENIPGNRYAVTVEIVRDDNGEVVYKSGLIDPGYYVQYAKLDKDLSAGTYDCVARFTAYDAKTKKEIGTAGIQIRLNILG